MSLVDVLSAAFDKSAGLATQCRRSSQLAFTASGSTKRIFDEFPCLLAEDDITDLCHGFSRILEQVTPTQTQDDMLVLTNSNDRLMVHAWQNKIAQIGIRELLDGNGYIRPDVRQLLDWQMPLSQKQVCEVICGYVSAINQEVMQRLDAQIQAKNDSFSAICDEVNKNLGGWVITELKVSRRAFDLRSIDAINSSKLTASRGFGIGKREAAIIAGVGVAAAGAFLLAGLGLASLFAAARRGPLDLSPPTLPRRADESSKKQGRR